jgi:tRNA dimethylallyltransferase
VTDRTRVVLGVVGATATGKSAFALALAEELGGEIVSCDSMQIYRGLDVGTAKPTAAERARVPHHLVDVVDPDEQLSAARWAELADFAIDDIRGRGRVPIVVGGTGLYFRALRWGLVAAPARDEALRAELYALEAAEVGALHRRLQAVDPVAAARLAPRDLQRIVRALEVAALSGRPLSEAQAEHAAAAVERHPMRVALLDPRPELVERAIEARTRAMLANGLVDETRRMRARFGPNAPAFASVGYREVCELLDGALAEEQLEPAIVRATRRYARRQRTWFKKERDLRMFAEADEAAAWLRGVLDSAPS